MAYPRLFSCRDHDQPQHADCLRFLPDFFYKSDRLSGHPDHRAREGVHGLSSRYLSDLFVAFDRFECAFSSGLLSNAQMPTLAKAAKEIMSKGPQPELRKFLDISLSSRIGRRILAEHHVAIHSQFYAPEKHPNVIGILSLACDPGPTRALIISLVISFSL